MSSEEKITAINEKNNENINVTGYWKLRIEFKSDKRIFVEKGDYSITNKYRIKQEFSCPGLHECFLKKIENIKCEKVDNKVLSSFILTNEDDESTLKYNYKIDKRILGYSKKSKSKELENLTIKREGDKFILELDSDLNITEFEVIHGECIGKNYVYSRVQCLNDDQINFKGKEADESNIRVIDPNRLKCGGLLDIYDRVTCRINLESEKEEYENFFPEECKNHKDPDKCLNIYRSVSECWDILTSSGRISCLKENIDLKDERGSCNSLECKRDLNDKLITMIKLRFYNLEEQAEILEENGILDKDDLINFVVEIEQKKLKFNYAETKEEMKSVIKEVRILWKDLMKKRI